MSALSGRCTGLDDDTMFPEPPEGGTQSPRQMARYLVQVADAKALCEACPVRTECLAGALARREEFGIWGGTLPEEREALIGTLGELYDEYDEEQAA